MVANRAGQADSSAEKLTKISHIWKWDRKVKIKWKKERSKQGGRKQAGVGGKNDK